MRPTYKKSLARAKSETRSIKMLWQHDPAQPIGVWDEVREDEKGLYIKGRILDEVAKGREAVALIKAGAMDGLSIGYQVRKATKGADGSRELRDLDLWEVSLVTFPMQIEARATIKSLSDEVEKKRCLEEALRDVGFSGKESKHGASVLLSQVLGRDDSEAIAEMAESMKRFMRNLRD